MAEVIFVFDPNLRWENFLRIGMGFWSFGFTLAEHFDRTCQGRGEWNQALVWSLPGWWRCLLAFSFHGDPDEAIRQQSLQARLKDSSVLP